MCVLNDDWVRTLCALLDRDWQIADLEVSDFNTILSQKIARNKARFRATRTGPACRMVRYAKPVFENVFERD
jgi:hypothetical protein